MFTKIIVSISLMGGFAAFCVLAVVFCNFLVNEYDKFTGKNKTLRLK